ncbi:MAG: NAD(P)/FAD-dependent oxidoreductase [Balneolaceae bacterium]
MQTNGTEHIVIVGGGFGGISVAIGLKRSGAKVTLIDKTNHHLFQPLLYQVATAALSPGDIAAPIREVIGKNSGVKVLLGEVVGVQPDKKILSLRNGRSISYDRLVLAPGAQYNYFGHDDWKSHAPSLKSMADALEIRERILLSLEQAEQIENPEERERYLSFVIVGGGPTGVEMAGAIAEIAKRNMMRDFSNLSKNESRIYLVEAAPQILNGYPPSLAEKARTMLEEMGVRVLLNTPVKEITKGRVQFPEGGIESANIIWAAGVAASPLLGDLGTDRDRSGRVVVRGDLSLASHPEIHVIGDAAHLKDEDGVPLPAIAPVALQQGRYLAKRLRRMLKGEQPDPESDPFRYTDKGTMATIGRAKAVADIRGFKLSGFPAWVLWSFVHILFLIGFRNRFRVFVEWMWFYFTFKRGVRLITNRPERNSNADSGTSRSAETE